MSNTPNPIPEGYSGATPYLCVRDAARAIEFYKQAFAAEELMRLADPQGKLMHAELQINTARIMLSDEYPAMGAHSPQALNGSPVTIHMYFDNVDAVAERAIAAGMTVLRPVEDQFYGDRGGTLQDPFGHKWSIATHIEDVSDDDIQKRAAALFG